MRPSTTGSPIPGYHVVGSTLEIGWACSFLLLFTNNSLINNMLNVIILGHGSEKSCTSVYNTLKNYKDITGVAHTLIENFFNEKISYIKSKNKQFAALRDIEDQIKTQCK